MHAIIEMMTAQVLLVYTVATTLFCDYALFDKKIEQIKAYIFHTAMM